MAKRLHRLTAVLIALCTLLSAVSITASALSWDGSSNGGGGEGGAATTKGFSVRSTDDNNCLGYRFSVVDKTGNTKNGTVIDVFRTAGYGKSEYANAYKYNTKYNKKQLINNQNSGFSTSKNTTNCYREADMGFASALPAPSGIGTWQNNTNNLNPVLRKLGITSIDALKNGDKVIVEPLYNVRLQTVYHSVTTTELSIYGKWLLGANSDGGSSANSDTWGFISNYTNKHYPNSLYTPDGQGLWTGVGSLSRRATFYNIINQGYGVGIAYTETKPDFTPALSVNLCEAWPGSKGVRNNNHYGISYGSSFANYSYAHGYPVSGDTVWFCVNFPSESENCYVKQSVWVEGGGSTSRNVYSNSNTWYEVQLSPSSVSSSRSYYTVKARVDWINSNGSVRKYGAEKTFYIPVRPKINRYQVDMVDITGKTAAYSGSGGSSGRVYVGQRTYVQYTYTSNNTWTSYNDLTGAMYQWSGSSWSRVKAASDDASKSSASLVAGRPQKLTSDLGYVRVPDNSQSRLNAVRFNLTSKWTADRTHTTQSTWINIPVVRADAELAEIRLIDEDGYYVSGDTVLANQTVTPQYVYRNNTACTVFVEGYNSDGTKMDGIYAIPANGTIAVNGKAIQVGASNTFSVEGSVYLEGAGKGNTSWEKTDTVSRMNNQLSRLWTIKPALSIEAITPNAQYREGVQVMSSFKVYNNSSRAVIPDSNVSVKLSVYNGTTLLTTQTKTGVVIPGRNNNLVYFKWTVPSDLNGAYLIVNGEILVNGVTVGADIFRTQSGKAAESQTPDTDYEAKRPEGWAPVTAPPAYASSASWSEWVYQNGAFSKRSYTVALSTAGLVITPDEGSPSAKLIDGVWNMKSGYGFSLNWDPALLSVGSNAATTSMYTPVQTAYAQFPEFRYAVITGQYRTLENLDAVFHLKTNPAADNARIHFIPVWYPNGIRNYTVVGYAYDCWTPAGMIVSRTVSNSFTINGSLYDDHYIGRQ